MPAKKTPIEQEDERQLVEAVTSWPAMLKYLIARNGIGVIFLALLIPVYADLKASTAQYAALGEANVRAFVDLANQIKEQRAATEAHLEAMKIYLQTHAQTPPK